MVRRVAVLGSNGMLSMGIQKALSQAGLDFDVIGRSTFPVKVDASSSTALHSIEENFGKGDIVINCVGVTKSRIDSNSSVSIESAVQVNSLFPLRLAKVAEENQFQVIQPATDCVFSGNKGNYTELSPHDPLDIYGKTKSLGESASPNVLHLRCSLVGREVHGRNTLLYSWVTHQPHSSRVPGYTNHVWNGLTNQVFGKIVAGIISNNLRLSGIAHVVPGDAVTKAKLVGLIAEREGRLDLRIIPEEAEPGIDRTLSTVNQNLNDELFSIAGYSEPPSVEEMVLSLD